MVVDIDDGLTIQPRDFRAIERAAFQHHRRIEAVVDDVGHLDRRDALKRVQVRGRRIVVDDAYGLAECVQRVRERQLRADGVAVRPGVRGQYEGRTVRQRIGDGADRITRHRRLPFHRGGGGRRRCRGPHCARARCLRRGSRGDPAARRHRHTGNASPVPAGAAASGLFRGAARIAPAAARAPRCGGRCRRSACSRCAPPGESVVIRTSVTVTPTRPGVADRSGEERRQLGSHAFCYAPGPVALCHVEVDSASTQPLQVGRQHQPGVAALHLDDDPVQNAIDMIPVRCHRHYSETCPLVSVQVIDFRQRDVQLPDAVLDARQNPSLVLQRARTGESGDRQSATRRQASVRRRLDERLVRRWRRPSPR